MTTAKKKVKQVTHLKDLSTKSNVVRQHNPRNIAVIQDSMQSEGAARSIVIDEAGEVLAGKGAVEAAALAGIENVIVVDADGKSLVAVRRVGLSDDQKLRLMMADNQATDLSKVNAAAIVEAYQQTEGQITQGIFTPLEITRMIAFMDRTGKDGLLFAGSNGSGAGSEAGDGAEISGDLPPSMVRMVPLFLTIDSHPLFLKMCSALAEKYDTSTLTDTVLEVVRDAYNTTQKEVAKRKGRSTRRATAGR